MIVADCGAVETDASGKEMVSHGTMQFPLAIYHDHLEIMAVDWHWHSELELIYQIEGEGLFCVNDKKWVLHEGEGMFINAEALHGCWCADTSICEICSIVFHPRLVGGGIESVFWQKYLEPLIQNHSFQVYAFQGEEAYLAKEIRVIWEKCCEEKEGYEFEVRNRLSQLLYMLCQKQGNSERALSAKNFRNSERMKLMLNYIHTNYTEPLRVGDIAKSAMLSESECLRCFKETIGASPSQYLKNYRISKACEILKNTSLTVYKVSELCGFSDESYFVKQFREAVGVTPVAYRKR